MPTTFERDSVYRIELESDAKPRARLAICPVAERGHIRFFDSHRMRSVRGELEDAKDAPEGAVVVRNHDGERVIFLPLTAERYLEVRGQIDGQPELSSDAAVRDFFVELMRGAA
jgi:hypothetical protein